MNNQLINLKNKLKKMNNHYNNEKLIATSIQITFKLIAKRENGEELTADEKIELDRACKIIGW